MGMRFVLQCNQFHFEVQMWNLDCRMIFVVGSTHSFLLLSLINSPVVVDDAFRENVFAFFMVKITFKKDIVYSHGTRTQTQTQTQTAYANTIFIWGSMLQWWDYRTNKIPNFDNNNTPKWYRDGPNQKYQLFSAKWIPNSREFKEKNCRFGLWFSFVRSICCPFYSSNCQLIWEKNLIDLGDV